MESYTCQWCGSLVMERELLIAYYRKDGQRLAAYVCRECYHDWKHSDDGYQEWYEHKQGEADGIPW